MPASTPRRLIPALVIASLAWTAPAVAHPGGLNAEGCHTNRKTGEYHCHRGGSTSRPQSPATTTSPAQPLLAPDRPYRNCAEARAAGAAPVLLGAPGYGAHLDRDGDGIGCE